MVSKGEMWVFDFDFDTVTQSFHLCSPEFTSTSIPRVKYHYYNLKVKTSPVLQLKQCLQDEIQRKIQECKTSINLQKRGKVQVSFQSAINICLRKLINVHYAST